LLIHLVFSWEQSTLSRGERDKIRHQDRSGVLFSSIRARLAGLPQHKFLE